MSTRHIAAEDARLHDLTPQGSSGAASKRFRRKLAADGFTVDEGFRLKPGYLYTVVRAISARVNQNYDGWPSDELKKSYKTFIGKPCFVNHENHDPTKARGVVVAARYAENGMDKYIEVVQEIDANRFPKLAHEIKTGGLDSVSMGAEAGFTICSYCHNKATDLHDMCDHVINHKGKTLSRLDRKTGRKEDVLVFESCHKISFFELSYVFEPADETAVASKVVVAGLNKTARNSGESHSQYQDRWYAETYGKNYKPCISCGTETDAKDRESGQPQCPSCMMGDHLELESLGPDIQSEKDWNPEDDPFDPRIIGANRRTAEDLAVPAPPGTKTIDQSVIDSTPVVNLSPATELTGHEAPGLPKQGFAADIAEITRMAIHRHAGDCPPGMDCSRSMAEGEQIGKDTPNNPVNQVSYTPGNVGRPSGGGGSADGDGILPGSRALYDQLLAEHPGAEIGGYRPPGDGYDEHANGALDFMTTDDAQAAKVREQAFAAGAPYVIWKQQQWNPDGSVSKMEDRGDPTQNHFDHVHIAPLPATPPPAPAAPLTPAKTKTTAPTTRAAGKYTKEDFAVGDGKKPWERDTESDTEDAAAIEIEAMLHLAETPTDDYKDWEEKHGEEAERNRHAPGWAPISLSQQRWLREQEIIRKRMMARMIQSATTPNADVAIELVRLGGIIPWRSIKTSAPRGSGRVPNNLQGLVGTWIRHQTTQAGPDGKPMRDETGRVIRVPAKPLDPSKPVFVHYNFPAVKKQKETGVPQPHLWSVEQDGYVRGYTNRLHLSGGAGGPVQMTVAKAGADKAMQKEVRNVHAGAEGYLAPHPEQPLPYSKINYAPFRQYDPATGTNFFYHEDDYDHPVSTADEMHFSQHAQMHGAQADNWGRSQSPQVVFPPPPDLNASNPDTVRPDIMEQAKLRGKPQKRDSALKKVARNTALIKTARRRALKLAFGEKEAPMAVDTLREEGSAPEDDNNDDRRYVDPPEFENAISSPQELQDPDLSQATQIDREQELAESGGDPNSMGQPGAADPLAAEPQAPQQQYMTLQIPIPPQGMPQVPQQAAPPVMPTPQVAPAMPPEGMPADPAQQAPQQIAASVLDYFDGYYGRRVANWLDAIEAGRDMNPAEVADYRRQAGKLSTLENGRELSTTTRNPTKGTANMARNSIARRNKVATTGRRQHFAEGGPLVDGGDRSRNDQGEQEEAFISQTPPEVPVDFPSDDAVNISNTEHNLVARVQRGRNQLLRDAQQLASLRQRRAFDEAGGPTAEIVDPRVNVGPEGEALTGTDFVSADPNDGVVPTNPKDASLRAFKAFDGWLTSKTGKSSRRHTEATIKKAAAAFSREAGISPQMLFPALGIVLREARKNDKIAKTKGAKMRKRANESLEVAAPDGRVDVEAPVSNTDAEAQASQFDLHDFGNNAGDNVADPDLSTDQNWAPGEASKTGARVKTAGGLLAMRCAEGMIAAGLEPNSRERKYQLAAEFERMNRGLIQDRVALLERFAAVRQAERRKVASGSSRGAARSPIPAGLGGGTRTASAGMRLAANDPSNDSSLFI